MGGLFLLRWPAKGLLNENIVITGVSTRIRGEKYFLNSDKIK